MKKFLLCWLLLFTLSLYAQQPCLSLLVPPAESEGFLDLAVKGNGNYLLLGKGGPGALMELTPDGQTVASYPLSSHHFQHILIQNGIYLLAGSDTYMGCSDPDIEGSVATVAAYGAGGNFLWYKDLELFNIAYKAVLLALMPGNGADDFYIATQLKMYHLNTQGVILDAFTWADAGLGGQVFFVGKNSSGGFDVFQKTVDFQTHLVQMTGNGQVILEKNLTALSNSSTPVIVPFPDGGWMATYTNFLDLTCRFSRLNAAGDIVWTDEMWLADNAFYHARVLNPVGNECWMAGLDSDFHPRFLRLNATNGAWIGYTPLESAGYQSVGNLNLVSLPNNRTIILGGYKYTENNHYYQGSALWAFNCSASTGTETTFADNGWQAYPNPATNSITLTPAADASGNWALYDLSGRLVASGAVKESCEIATGQFPRGICLLQVTDHTGRQFAHKILLK